MKATIISSIKNSSQTKTTVILLKLKKFRILHKTLAPNFSDNFPFLMINKSLNFCIVHLIKRRIN